jgi:hypothetical protein
MFTRELDACEWLGFFSAFSRHYKGVPMTLNLPPAHGGVAAEVIARDLPLVGVTAECRYGDGRVTSIDIMLGSSLEDHVIHTINRPTHVFIGQISNGSDETIVIHSQTDPPVELDFRERGPLGENGSAHDQAPHAVWTEGESTQSGPPA